MHLSLFMSQHSTKTDDRCGHHGVLLKITVLWVLRNCQIEVKIRGTPLGKTGEIIQSVVNLQVS